MADPSEPEASGSNGAPADPADPSEEAAEASTPEPEPDPLAEAKAEAARFREQLLRTAADFENFRKRTRKELPEAEQKGREAILRDLFPVFDNLERAVAHAGSASDLASLRQGIEMVMRLFSDTLAKIGIVRVPAVGMPFDPSRHEAIQQMETTDFPPGTVAAEIQGGYAIGDRLIRPAMVVVAKAPTSEQAAETPESGDPDAGPGEES